MGGVRYPRWSGSHGRKGGQGVVVFVSWSGRWRFPLRNDELNPNMKIMVSVKHANSQQGIETSRCSEWESLMTHTLSLPRHFVSLIACYGLIDPTLPVSHEVFTRSRSPSGSLILSVMVVMASGNFRSSTSGLNQNEKTRTP